MNENIKKFLEKVVQDQEAIAKFSAIKDPDEAYKLASSIQDGFTKEEFITAMEELRNSAGNFTELTDEDLSKVAGGEIGVAESVITTIVGSVQLVGAFAASAI